MSRSLDTQSPEFDERNLFLFLTLGLLSLGEELEQLLRDHAPEAPTRIRGRLGTQPEPLAYLLLGAIRVRDVIRRELRTAASETHEAPSAGSASELSDGAATGDLLR